MVPVKYWIVLLFRPDKSGTGKVLWSWREGHNGCDICFTSNSVGRRGGASRSTPHRVPGIANLEILLQLISATGSRENGVQGPVGDLISVCMGAKDVDGFKVNLFDYRIRTSTVVRGHQEHQWSTTTARRYGI